MSAFIVSDDTIRAIVTFAFGPRGVGTVRKIPDGNRPGDWRALKDYTPEQVGRSCSPRTMPA